MQHNRTHRERERQRESERERVSLLQSFLLVALSQRTGCSFVSFCSTEAHHRLDVVVAVVVAVAVAAACSFLFMLRHADALVAYTLSSD